MVRKKGYIKEVEEIKKFLTLDEALRMERENNKLAVLRLESVLHDSNMLLLKEKIRALELEQKALAANRMLKVIKDGKNSDAYQEFISKVNERLSLKNKWGFNPETLEIIEEE